MNIRTILIAFFLTAGAAGFSQEITEANWVSHPEIVAVRTVVNAIEAGVKNGPLKHLKKEKAYEKPYRDTRREVWRDKAGRVVKLIREAGSDDSSLTWNHYYDDTGRLRFVFITGGAVNGTRIEHRLYYNEYGDRIWEFQKLVAGPGYTFPRVWPDKDIVYNAKDFPLATW